MQQIKTLQTIFDIPAEECEQDLDDFRLMREKIISVEQRMVSMGYKPVPLIEQAIEDKREGEEMPRAVMAKIVAGSPAILLAIQQEDSAEILDQILGRGVRRVMLTDMAWAVVMGLMWCFPTKISAIYSFNRWSLAHPDVLIDAAKVFEILGDRFPTHDAVHAFFEREEENIFDIDNWLE